MNETKQNSSTDMDDDCLAGGNELKKCSIQQETIIEFKESCAEDHKSGKANGSFLNGFNKLAKPEDELNGEKFKSLIQKESTTKLDARLRIHRNSSIDLTCDRNRRNKLHRHNDSRRRYRRKTIANMDMKLDGDCGKNSTSFTSCV